MIKQLREELKSRANPEKAVMLQKFFKTGKGQYGEGDVFLGITVPETRELAKKHHNFPLNKIKTLLNSRIHEERLLAILLLVHKYQNQANEEEIVKFYLNNTKRVNSWDLVDLSADKILGPYLKDKDK